MTKEDFWNWFDQNKQLLEKMITDRSQDYTIYEELSAQLSQYSKHLIPELTMTTDNKFVLVISCDGMKEGTPFAELLTENIKEFDNWVVVKYRQPDPMESIPINGITLKLGSIFLTWKKTSSQKYFLTFYLKGFSLYNKNYEIATLLHMDHTIGEYNAMTRIEGVEIKKMGLFQSKKGLCTLADFKKELDNTVA
jgi:hypothetical protein